MDPARPSLELLRALMQHRRLTRAEQAAQTGISKPTVGESVRRLAEAGLVADTGQRTAGGSGAALAVSIAPAGIVAECIDAYGEVVSRAEEQISRSARPEQAAAALRIAAARARRGAGLIPRLAAVSA